MVYEEPKDPLTGKGKRHVTASMKSVMGLGKSIIDDSDEWLISPQPISVLLHKGVIIKPNSLSNIDISAAVREIIIREEDEVNMDVDEDLSQWDAQEWIMRNNKFDEVIKEVIKIKQADVENIVNQTLVHDYLVDYLTRHYGDTSIRMAVASGYSETEYKKLNTYSEGISKAENKPLFDKLVSSLILINFGSQNVKVPLMKVIASAALMRYYYRARKLLPPFVDEDQDKIPYIK